GTAHERRVRRALPRPGAAAQGEGARRAVTPPTVVVPVQAPAPGLDACLAALERSLPDGAAVLVADDACADPRIGELAAGWCRRTRVGARYLRRPRALGFAGNLE